uniref:Paired domain-containing protein n=1 Tax=Rhabditophanes sp. KR3021 TaxID=114890 RepID=A0AC35U4R8_9BILA
MENFCLDGLNCRCVIDDSTPDSLTRDFTAWLNGNAVNRHDYLLHRQFYNSHAPLVSMNEYYIINNNNNNNNFIENNEFPSLKNSNNNNQDEPVGKKGKKKNSHRRVSGTNLYGRAYCPGRPLSTDDRYRIVELYEQGMKVNAISKVLCVSHGCVSKIISRFRETGSVLPFSNSENRRNRRIAKRSDASSTHTTISTSSSSSSTTGSSSGSESYKMVPIQYI